MDLHINLSLKDKQKLIDFIAKSYSPEDIFSLGRNVEIDKDSYFGFGMNNYQLSEAFVSRVIQNSKETELFNIIRNHEYLSRNSFNQVFEIAEPQHSVDTKSMLNSVYAVIIGVNDYSKVNCFRSLSYCEKDAQIIKNVLKSRWNVNENNIFVFNESKNTNYVNINEVLKKVILEREEDDNILFYFSGHGDEVNGNSYLILSDTKEDTITGEYENAIVLSELNDLFKQSKAKIKLRIFDACKCGQSFSKEKSKNLTQKFKSDMFGTGNGWVTITSCNINEYSYETYGKNVYQNSIFTHYLAEGMLGKAKRGLSRMHIEDLKIYISEKVPRDTNYEQNPQYHCEIEGNILIE